MKKGTLLALVGVLGILGTALVGCASAPEGNPEAQSQTAKAAADSGNKKLGKMDEHLGVK